MPFIEIVMFYFAIACSSYLLLSMRHERLRFVFVAFLSSFFDTSAYYLNPNGKLIMIAKA